MKLRGELISSFVLCGALVLAVGLVGVYSSWRANQDQALAARYGQLHAVLLKRQLDHLNWIRAAGEFQRDDSLTVVNVHYV